MRMSDMSPDTSPSPSIDEAWRRCTLAEARKGQHFTVTAVDDERARVTCLRFGMAEGACVQCVARIAGGPIVLKSGRQEIAVGRELAKRIRVQHREPAGAAAGEGGR
jgi:Fe2+ transport system protein FeoA